MVSRVVALPVPYKRRVYRVESSGVYSLTASCWLKLATEKDLVLVKGVSGIDTVKPCGKGRVTALGPNTSAYGSRKGVKLFDKGCREIGSFSRNSLISGNGYTLALVDRKRGVVVLDSFNGVYVYETSASSEALDLSVGVSMAVVQLENGIMVVSPRSLDLIPGSDVVDTKPLAYVDGLPLLMSGDGFVYAIEPSGSLEEYVRCLRPTIVVSKDGALVECDTGITIGSTNSLSTVVHSSLIGSPGRRIVCLPYVYVMKDDTVEAYDVSAQSTALYYPKLTGRKLVDEDTLTIIGEIDDFRDVANMLVDEEDACKSKLSYRYSVEGKHLELTISMDDEGIIVEDANCIANCTVLSISRGTVKVKVHRPDEPVAIELWIKGCGDKFITIPEATKELKLGVAYPFNVDGSLALLVRGGKVIVSADSGIQVLGEGLHIIPKEPVWVYDRLGRISVDGQPLRVRARLDYRTGLIVVENAVKVRGCSGVEEKGKVIVDLTWPFCSVKGIDGNWYLITPLRLALSIALRVSNRIAELLELAEDVAPNLLRIWKVHLQRAVLHNQV